MMQYVPDEIKKAEDNLLTHLKKCNSFINLHIISYGYPLDEADAIYNNIYENDINLRDSITLEYGIFKIKHLTHNKTYLFSTLTNKINCQQSLQDLIQLSDLILTADVSATWQRHAYQRAFGEQILTSLVIHNDQQPHLLYLGLPLAIELSDNKDMIMKDKTFRHLSKMHQVEKSEPAIKTYLKQIILLDHDLKAAAIQQKLTQLFKKRLTETIATYHERVMHGMCQASGVYPTSTLLDLNWLTQGNNVKQYELESHNLPTATKAVLTYLAQELPT